MTIIIHGSPVSTCTQRIVVVAKQLGIPYELKDIGQNWAVTKTPEWLEKQPFGQIPYLEDGTFFLYESRPITRYLVAKYGKGSTLVPPASGVEETARFEVAASVEVSNFDKYASDLVSEKVFKAWRGLPADEARVKVLTDMLEQRLDGYERILGKQKYLAGETLTLTDLWHLPYGWKVTNDVGSDIIAKRPNVARWWDEITSLPAWKEVAEGKI